MDANKEEREWTRIKKNANGREYEWIRKWLERRRRSFTSCAFLSRVYRL